MKKIKIFYSEKKNITQNDHLFNSLKQKDIILEKPLKSSIISKHDLHQDFEKMQPAVLVNLTVKNRVPDCSAQDRISAKRFLT